MKRIMLNVLISLVAAVWSLHAADPAYIGKWKLNTEKSQLTGMTLSFEETPEGAIRITTGYGLAYNFKLDGKEYPTGSGGTTSWKAPAPNTWETTARSKEGKVTRTLVSSLTGDTMLVAGTTIKPDGGTSDYRMTLTRISGGPGFLGKWKNTDYKAVATGIELTPDGADGVIVKFPDTEIACKAKFDGKDYALNWGNRTWSLKKTGPDSFEITEKLNGTISVVTDVSTSENGKIMNFESTAFPSKEMIKEVYDRQ